MGQLPVQPLDQRLERTRRAHPQPLRARPQSLRLQFRIGCSGDSTPRSTIGSERPMADEREVVARARRIVVKLGSRNLASAAGIFDRLPAGGAARPGGAVWVVSSGAIALGMKKLGYRARPKEIARLQAAAAAGQSLLMRAYEEAFEARHLAVAQVLLTHADLADRTRANNARAALGALLDAGAVPILNENDSVAVDEIRFGDNDQLAAIDRKSTRLNSSH